MRLGEDRGGRGSWIVRGENPLSGRARGQLEFGRGVRASGVLTGRGVGVGAAR